MKSHQAHITHHLLIVKAAIPYFQKRSLCTKKTKFDTNRERHSRNYTSTAPAPSLHPRHNNNCISGLCACSLREGLVCQQTFREESDSRDHVCCPKSGALVPAGSLSDNGDITSCLRCPEHHSRLAGSPVASTF